MSEENKAVVRRWFEEVWNQKRLEVIHEMMSEDTVHHGVTGPGEEPMKGLENFRKFHRDFVRAFPDIHFEIEDVVAEGNKVAARYTATATQQGPLPNFDKVTGNRVKFTGGGICTIENGKFGEVWNEIDFTKMFHDLSLEPAE